MRRLEILIVMILLSSCGKRNAIAQVEDKYLKLQVSSEKHKNSDGVVEYNVRIFHHKELEPEAMKKISEQFLYHMDSCFYQFEGTKKIYPVGILPMTNGIKNCFEYIITFEDVNEQIIDKNNFNYQDKYISGKTYQLSLK